MQRLNQTWLRLRALFKKSAMAKDTEGAEETRKQELIARDLGPAKDAVGGASHRGMEAKPGQNRPREIDFMNDSTP